MNGRNGAARILVALGAMVLIAAALLHLSDYPKDLSAVSASNLGASLQRAVRALYFGLIKRHRCSRPLHSSQDALRHGGLSLSERQDS